MPVDLRNANLRGKNLAGVDWEEANLDQTNLEEANLYQAVLTNASMLGTHLRRANLAEANMLGVQHMTVAQLRESFSLKGATMPDGKVFPNSDGWHKAFDQWSLAVKTDEDGHILT